MSNELYDWLDYWCYSYNVSKGCIDAKFMKLHKLLGITSYDYVFYHKKRIAKIEIKEYLRIHPFACKSVCWHEFCHAEVWIRDGYTDGHSTAWVKRMLRKPWYVIGCVYAQFICIGK